jgi:LemA protein
MLLHSGFAWWSCSNQAMAYNTDEQSFPQDLLAGAFGHGPDASPLEFKGSAQFRAAPTMSF